MGMGMNKEKREWRKLSTMQLRQSKRRMVSGIWAGLRRSSSDADATETQLSLKGRMKIFSR